MNAHNLTRRHFLTAAAASGGLALAKPSYHPKLGCQAYVWTQQFRKDHKKLEEGLDEAFASIHRAGYHRVELTAEFFATEVREKTAKSLKSNHLDLIVAYYGGIMHDAQVADKTIRDALEVAVAAKAMGSKLLIVNCNPAKEGRKTDDQLETQVRTLNLLGKELYLRDMGLLVHEHAPELQENAREWYYNLTHTDPQQVLIGLDVDWVKRAGLEPMTLIKEAGERIGSMHLRNAEKGVWLESLDKGDVNYEEVAAYLKENGYTGYLVVELAYEKDTKITRPLEEDLKLSREFAEKTFGIRA